ncbi:periphilin-1-like isoform X1 [Sphaeramia orbicularis]|uniref:Periphilin-1-like n=1 Tax=Sphaeramia orbicularis TaxID=375764 RepID=A0A672ZX88_9TELE|nr:periphilin-1-like isoform X1 [Sphaeramia orbicularis]
MDHTPQQNTQQSKGSAVRHREHSDESVDKKALDSSRTPTQSEKRPIRRVRSPSRPRAWLSTSRNPKVGGHYYKSRFPKDDRPFYKSGFSNHRHQPFNYFHRKDYHRQKLQPFPLRGREKERDWEKEREPETERYDHDKRDGTDGSSPPKQSTSSRPFSHKSSSSRDKDKQFTVSQSDRSQSRESDHKGSKSKERERSRDGELPSTASQTVARDLAIQQKRKEIDEVYYQECEMFGLVVKMLIEKDPSLEVPIQSSLQKNLRDIGARCVEAMERFIEEYDSREKSQ